MRYYSELTKCEVSEPEAIKQIIDLCDRWYQLAHPNISFNNYLRSHSQLLDIEQWACFRRIS